MSKIITLSTLERYNNNLQQVIDDKVQKLMTEHNHDERYYTKAEVDELLSNYVSLEYCTNNDILRLFDPSIPETPVDPEPDTPTEPDVVYPSGPEQPVDPEPVESIGEITDDNSIVIDETQLENGIYTLRYIDAYGNIIYNFNEITSFEINN